MASELPLPAEQVRRGVAWFIVLFWVAQFMLLTAQQRIAMPETNVSYLAPRMCVTILGIVISFGIVRVGRRYAGRPIRLRLVITFLSALGGCMLHASGNFLIFQLFMPIENMRNADYLSYMFSIIQWFWSYLALSGLLLALSYSLESAEREHRIAELRGIADAAQLRALRYQLNPHFMFNTLNSIAALIGRRDIAPAEQMVENLADFLRASLTLDPQEDIPLQREIELQSLYLAIELERFADRFFVQTQVSEAAQRALVPSLVLQPLIENVIKHAVSTSISSVTLTIAAEVLGGRLHVSVRNSAGDGPKSAAAGTGVGLDNVARRISARFGARAVFSAERHADGGFAVNFIVPYHEAMA